MSLLSTSTKQAAHTNQFGSCSTLVNYPNGCSNIWGYPSTITTTGTNPNWNNQIWTVSSDMELMKDYIEFAFEIMGIDMSFEKFCTMDAAEKKKVLRKLKLKKIL